MLRQLSVQNFKSWRRTGDIDLAPLTGFFGTNSSGKTSLLQLLLMLKQTVDSSDRGTVVDLGSEKSLVELGTMEDVLFEHDVDAVLKWAIDWKLLDRLEVPDPASRGRKLFVSDWLAQRSEIQYSQSSSPNQVFVKEMTYDLGADRFSMKVRPSDGKYGLHAENSNFQFRRSQGRPWPLPAPAKCYGFPDEVRSYFQNAGFLADLELEFERLFSRLYYLGPLREHPRREYSYSGGRPRDMGQRGEGVVEAILASKDSDTMYSFGRGVPRKSLEEVVAHWLKELDLIESFEVRQIAAGSKLHQVWVKRHANAKEVLITDVGFGVSQILPVIALCYYIPEGSVILLEQPEIHLHPRVQAGLADVLIDAINRRNVQIIIESHSEHLLKRLQRRIAEQEFSTSQAALYFCSMPRNESKIERLDVDLFGNIRNWPDGFFGDEFAEIEAMQKAIRERTTS